jgi:hypothetical protein
MVAVLMQCCFNVPMQLLHFCYAGVTMSLHFDSTLSNLHVAY